MVTSYALFLYFLTWLVAVFSIQILVEFILISYYIDIPYLIQRFCKFMNFGIMDYFIKLSTIYNERHLRFDCNLSVNVLPNHSKCFNYIYVVSIIKNSDEYS